MFVRAASSLGADITILQRRRPDIQRIPGVVEHGLFLKDGGRSLLIAKHKAYIEVSKWYGTVTRRQYQGLLVNESCAVL